MAVTAVLKEQGSLELNLKEAGLVRAELRLSPLGELGNSATKFCLSTPSLNANISSPLLHLRLGLALLSSRPCGHSDFLCPHTPAAAQLGTLQLQALFCSAPKLNCPPNCPVA